MNSISFSWDDRKNKANKTKHRVSFEEAQSVFFDQHAIDFAKANAIKAQVKSLKGIYSFEAVTGCDLWEDVFTLGSDPELQEKVDQIKDKVKPSDLATIIYTSGTTGNPKGVMISNYNVLWTYRSLLESYGWTSDHIAGMRVVSYLPMAHIMGNKANLHKGKSHIHCGQQHKPYITRRKDHKHHAQNKQTQSQNNFKDRVNRLSLH